MLVPLDPTITAVMFARQALVVELGDGRTISAPLEWFPILFAAAPLARDGFVIANDGNCVTWPRLGERVSVEFLMARR